MSHRKNALEPVDIQILVPHIMGRWREHGIQPPVTQNLLARGREDDAGLKIEVREICVPLIGIDAEKQVIVPGNFAQRIIFRAVFVQRRFFGPAGDAFARRIRGEGIFGQHHEPEITADKGFRGANFAGQAPGGGADRGHGFAAVGAAIDRLHRCLQRQGIICRPQCRPALCHGFPRGLIARLPRHYRLFGQGNKLK